MKEKYLAGILDMNLYTVEEFEHILNKYYGNKKYEVVCDTNNRLIRIFVERDF